MKKIYVEYNKVKIAQNAPVRQQKQDKTKKLLMKPLEYYKIKSNRFSIDLYCKLLI